MIHDGGDGVRLLLLRVELALLSLDPLALRTSRLPRWLCGVLLRDEQLLSERRTDGLGDEYGLFGRVLEDLELLDEELLPLLLAREGFGVRCLPLRLSSSESGALRNFPFST